MNSLVSVEEASQIILAHLEPTLVETVSLFDASGYYLCEDIKAEIPFPPYDRVMMDGVAVNHEGYLEGVRSFSVEAIQPAGSSAINLSKKSSCIEVMTGAVLPTGCDCVIPLEHYENAMNVIYLKKDRAPKEGDYIHKMGSDSQKGQLLVESGALLRSTELAIAASCGMAQLKVSALPRILIASIGDELVSPGEKALPHQIHRSNDVTLHSLITENKLGTTSHINLTDDPSAMLSALKDATEQYDILVITGGISKGKYDYVAPVLKQLYGEPCFHGVAQRPGKPFAFWKKEKIPPVFALPGNPVSVFACAVRYLLPNIKKMLSSSAVTQRQMPCSGEFCSPAHLTGLIPCQMHEGILELNQPSNSGNFFSLSGCDGIVEMPAQFSGKDLNNVAFPFYPC